jgi:uncharacterized protein (DUF4415 family)
MRKHYDFSNSIRNPYTKKLKHQISIRVDNDILEYFKELSTDADIPYQKLMNLFLRDCKEKKKRPAINWEPQKVHA